jgi:2-polyprenyl-6-methoxyphenol hydroxylase-like FAD-dependent oxidoreductase
MQKDFIIVGQGAAGTFLSWYLLKEGFDIIVIDQVDKKAASYTAAGMINPVTGRRIVKSWMIDEIMPFAFEAKHIQRLAGTSTSQPFNKRISSTFFRMIKCVKHLKNALKKKQIICMPSIMMMPINNILIIITDMAR